MIKSVLALVCRDALIILKQTINYTDEYCKIVLIHSKLVPMHILCVVDWCKQHINHVQQGE